jgi:hypothetical protein
LELTGEQLDCGIVALKLSKCPWNDAGTACICSKTDTISADVLGCLAKTNAKCSPDDFYSMFSTRGRLILSHNLSLIDYVIEVLNVTANGCNDLGPSLLPNGTLFGNLTSNYTLPSHLPTSTPKPTLSPSTSSGPTPRRLSTGAYAGIGASAGIVGALALGFGIFWMIRRRRRREGKIELEGKDGTGPFEIFDKRKDAVEMPEGHGVSEAPAPVAAEPQELDSTEVGSQTPEPNSSKLGNT